VSDTPPVHPTAGFVDNDGMPSDHYLWLTGVAARALRREIPLPARLPLRDTNQPARC